MSPFEVYCILMLDNIRVLSVSIFLISIFALIVIEWLKSEGTLTLLGKKIYITTIFTFFVFLFLCTLIPTTNQAFVIYALPKIANNENIQKLPDLAMQALNAELKKIANDTKNT